MESLFANIHHWLKDSVTDESIDLKKLSNDSAEPAQTTTLKALELLAQIKQQLDNPSSDDPQDLIAVSLQDMKTVNLLIKIVLFCGIVTNLDFKMPSKWQLPEIHNREFLALVLDKLHQLLSIKDDLADIVSMTQFQPYVVAGAVQINKLDEFTPLIGTYQLYQTYMMLLSSTSAPESFKQFISSKLSKLPFEREDAVRAMVELFSGYRQQETIQIERMEPLVDILSHPPQGITLSEYLETINNQIFAVIATPRTPLDITAAVCYLVDLLDMRARPNLKFLRDNMLIPLKSPDDKRFEGALMALTNLSERKRASAMVLHIAKQVFPTIWLLFVHLCEGNVPNGSVLKLLIALIDLDHTFIDTLIANIMIVTSGGLMPVITAENTLQGPQARLVEYVSNSNDAIDFELMDRRIDIALTVLSKLPDTQLTGTFISLLRASLKPDLDSSLVLVLQLKLLQRIGQDFKSRLFTHPSELVDMCISVVGLAVQQKNSPQVLEPLSQDQDSDDEDNDDHEIEPEMLEICVDMLTGVLLESVNEQSVVQQICAQRETIQQVGGNDADENLKYKVSYCLKLIDGIAKDGTIDMGDDDVNYENSYEVLQTAKNSLRDSLVPVRAHGLQLLRKLVERKDSVLDVETALELTLKQLKDEDSYLYLNAIKTIEQCSFTYGPNAIVPTLIRMYGSPAGELDVTLRIGEAIVKIVQASAKAFTPESTSSLISTLVAKVRVQNSQDERIRMSSMSIMGWLVSENALGLHREEHTILDCCIGVLQLEKDCQMQRSALVLLLEIVNHINEGTLTIDSAVLSTIKIQLGVLEGSPDEMVSNYAKDILAVL